MVSGLGSCQIDMDYLLGGDDRVVAVCPQWSQAARERMAVELDEEMVLGRRLWDFVHGGAAQRLYDALLWHARTTGRKLTFAYRGDSPGAVRYMRLALLPDARNRVRIRSELLHEQPRQREVYFTHTAYPRHPDLLQCSLCQKLEHNGQWMTVSDALAKTDLLDDLLPAEVGDTVCDNCITKVELATGLRL